MPMSKVSIIIPVYNAKDYLERCLDSVCNQTLKDIEIICINDCSTDNSLEILKRYALKDSRITIIDCEINGGESKARNLGLERATGEYIAFVDNDDTVDLDFYEKLYLKAFETNADFVKGNTYTVNLDNTSHFSQLNSQIREKGKWFFHYEWWSAIYKNSIIQKYNLRLPEGYSLGGDSLFLNEFLIYADKYCTIDDTSYHWLRRENSGESPVLSLDKVTSALKLFERIEQNANRLFLEKNIDEISYQHIISNCIWIAVNYMLRNDIRESKVLCCEYLIKFYENCYCKDFAQEYIFEQSPYFYLGFKNGKEDLINKVLSINNQNEYNKKNMFARIRLKRAN